MKYHAVTAIVTITACSIFGLMAAPKGTAESYETAFAPAPDRFALTSRLLGSGTAKTAGFGNAVDISGDTAVIGAWYDDIGRNKRQGSAYVFVKRKGVWVEQATLAAADGAARDSFGQKVAIDGDTIVVAAPMVSRGRNRYRGAVYVFTRTGDHWSKQVKLEPSAPTLVETFGSDIDISGDTIVVGAIGHDMRPDDNVPQAHGAAYIFKRSSGNWSERQILASDGLTNTGFGTSVAIHDNLAVIGTVSDEQAVGAAYVFAYDGIEWKRDGKLRSGVRRGSEHFALQSVAVDRGTVVVGASGAGSRGPGAAYVFNKGKDGWKQTAKLAAEGGKTEDSFGLSVDISGDTVVAGMFTLGAFAPPRAYVFTRERSSQGPVWTQSQLLVSPETFLGDNFAYCVAANGDNIIVGASNHDSDPRRKTRGAAYVFGAPGPGTADGPAVSARSGGQYLPLIKDARKNGYKIERVGGETFMRIVKAEDPVTRRLLDGIRTLQYRCSSTNAAVTELQTALIAGSSQRLRIGCPLVIEPRVLLDDEG